MYILLPDLYLLYFHQNIQIFLMSICLLAYIYSFFKSTKYLFILLPFFIPIPAYLYYISIYHVGINEQILSIILETDFQEAIQFLGGKIYLYLTLYLLWFTWCISTCHKHYKNPKVWYHWSRYFVLILGTFYFSCGYYFNAKIVNEINAAAGSAKNNFLVEEENIFTKDLKQTYPLGLIINGWYVYKEQRKINQSFEKNNFFLFNAQRIKPNNEKEIYILILGETSRRENWQLNGYERQTNPRLSQQQNLINFTDFISLSNATRSSIPMMLTRKLDRQVYQYEFNEKSIITVFKEAGFKTYWLSTQQKFGAFDTSTSVYAKEADEIHFLNKTGYQNAGVYDDILVSAVKKVVSEPVEKQFIVLHTLGSHYNYSHRYPEYFDYFKPSLNTVKQYSLQDKKYTQELRNSYDNSILFTDYVLDELIRVLDKQKDTMSFLMYSSDHGEDIFDGNCEKSGHGLETARNFEIASFVWYSNTFAEQYVNKIRFLKQNKNRKLNHTAIFPTLLDAANISIPNDNLEKSILKPFDDYERWVMGRLNFDQAKFVGECKEIK